MEITECRIDVMEEPHLKVQLAFALKVNHDCHSITDADIDRLNSVDQAGKGIVQRVQLVSNIETYNRLNIAHATDYDDRGGWREAACDWKNNGSTVPGGYSHGLRI